MNTNQQQTEFSASFYIKPPLSRRTCPNGPNRGTSFCWGERTHSACPGGDGGNRGRLSEGVSEQRGPNTFARGVGTDTSTDTRRPRETNGYSQSSTRDNIWRASDRTITGPAPRSRWDSDAEVFLLAIIHRKTNHFNDKYWFYKHLIRSYLTSASFISKHRFDRNISVGNKGNNF